MWSRAIAGVVAGFFLSAAAVGLVSWMLPGPWQNTIVPGIIAFFPVWIGVIGATFFFANGLRAWAWLGGLAVVLLAALWVLQSLNLVQ